MRRYCLVVIIALLGCNNQNSGKGPETGASVDGEEVVAQFVPAQVEMDIDQSMSSGMDLLSGKLNSDTEVLLSMDANPTVDKMLDAIEKKNKRKLAQYEQMGWLMTVADGDRFLALHADDFPYVRIQLESGNFSGRRGYIHKKYLDFDDKSLSLRRFTSDRGQGKAWRSR